MTIRSQLLASGAGWRVSDVVCTAGPDDRPFEERHEWMVIALVTGGTFNYRSTQGAAVLAPGALMLGNSGACFECGHQHSVGDRCLSFQLTPEVFEAVAAEVPGNRRGMFAAPRVPLLPELLPVVARAEALRREAAAAPWRAPVGSDSVANTRCGDPGVADHEFHELTLKLAGAVCRALSDDPHAQRAPTDRDERRVAAALRRIEVELAGDLSLRELAADAAMSPFHFLRVFEQIVGVTPAQYVLRMRLCRAAVELRSSAAQVATIAAECGFGDLSTFNRQFRRAMAATPGEFRAGGG